MFCDKADGMAAYIQTSYVSSNENRFAEDSGGKSIDRTASRKTGMS